MSLLERVRTSEKKPREKSPADCFVEFSGCQLESSRHTQRTGKKNNNSEKLEGEGRNENKRAPDVEEAMPSCAIEAPGYRFVVISSGNIDVPLLEEFHARLILPAFLPAEREDVPLWVRRLETPSDRLGWFALVAVDLATDRVVAGVTVELYLSSRCALLSFVVTHEEARGKGLASTLVREAHRILSEECCTVALATPSERIASSDTRPLAAVFIDVQQVRPLSECLSTVSSVPSKATSGRVLAVAGEDVSQTIPQAVASIDPGLRQKMWQKMHFVPLDLDLLLPGRHGAAFAYNLAVYCPPGQVAAPLFPAPLLLDFITALIVEYMRDDAEEEARNHSEALDTTREEIAIEALEGEAKRGGMQHKAEHLLGEGLLRHYQELLQGRSFVALGHQHWR